MPPRKRRAAEQSPAGQGTDVADRQAAQDNALMMIMTAQMHQLGVTPSGHSELSLVTEELAEAIR